MIEYNPEIHHRRSIRLQNNDYSQAGAYFLTICAQNQECLFGEIIEGEMRLNDGGRMFERWYSELENRFPDIKCDQFVCMPNHVHFIIVNDGASQSVSHDTAEKQTGGEDVGADLCVRPTPPTDQKKGEHIGSPLQRVIQWFKTMTTNEYIRGVKQNGWTPFAGKLWQRNYWERIVRNEDELNRIREYILNNPARWESDKLYPGQPNSGP